MPTLHASVGHPRSDWHPLASNSGRLLIALAALLALLAIAATGAVGAWVFGWYHREILLVSIGCGGAVVAAAIVLLYRQARQERAAHQALRDVEERMSGIVESAMDPIITLDERQRIVVFNSAAEQVFRWPRAAVIGEPLDKLLPPRFRQGHSSHIERFGRIGTTSRRMGAQSVLAALRANGEEFPIEASISQHAEGGRKLFTV